MFDIVRAALLRTGIAEDDMPRTHGGVSETFWRSAVQSGQIDPHLGAELFVQTVRRVFSLDEPFPDRDDRVSEPDIERERSQARGIDVRSSWLEEERRQARENWLRLRQQMN
jgi:hypothetical protein